MTLQSHGYTTQLHSTYWYTFPIGSWTCSAVVNEWYVVQGFQPSVIFEVGYWGADDDGLVFTALPLDPGAPRSLSPGRGPVLGRGYPAPADSSHKLKWCYEPAHRGFKFNYWSADPLELLDTERRVSCFGRPAIRVTDDQSAHFAWVMSRYDPLLHLCHKAKEPA